MWRVILRGKATLQEIDDHWDLTDVADANEALDVADDVESWRAALAKAEREAETRAQGLMGGG